MEISNENFIYITSPNETVHDDSDIEVIETDHDIEEDSEGTASDLQEVDVMFDCSTSSVNDNENTKNNSGVNDTENTLQNLARNLSYQNERLTNFNPMMISDPFASVTSSTVPRLQIVRASLEMESLPESDASLAAMEDAGIYENESGDNYTVASLMTNAAMVDADNNRNALVIDDDDADNQVNEIILQDEHNVWNPSAALLVGRRIRSISENATGVQNAETFLRNPLNYSNKKDSDGEILSKVAVLVLMFAIAMGLGHYLASRSFMSMEMTHGYMESISKIRGELGQCRQRQDDLEASLNDLKANMVSKRFVENWENLYQEGEVERESLKISMDFFKSRYGKEKVALLECQTKLTEASVDKSEESPPPSITQAPPLECPTCPLVVDLSSDKKMADLREQVIQLEKERFQLMQQLDESRKKPIDYSEQLQAFKEQIKKESNRGGQEKLNWQQYVKNGKTYAKKVKDVLVDVAEDSYKFIKDRVFQRW